MDTLGLYWTPEDLRKITSDILAGKRVTDTDVCILIEAGPYDRVKACIDAHWSTYYPSAGNYSNSIKLLAQKGWWDIYGRALFFNKENWQSYCRGGNERLFCPTSYVESIFRYSSPEILRPHMRILAPKCFPKYLIERNDEETYRLYRKYRNLDDHKSSYESTSVLEANDRGGYYGEYEFYDMLRHNACHLFEIMLEDVDLVLNDRGLLVSDGSPSMVKSYVKMRGMDEAFKQLLLCSGKNELVELANNPEVVQRLISQRQTNSKEKTDSGWLQKVKKFFGVTA